MHGHARPTITPCSATHGLTMAMYGQTGLSSALHGLSHYIWDFQGPNTAQQATLDLNSCIFGQILAPKYLFYALYSKTGELWKLYARPCMALHGHKRPLCGQSYKPHRRFMAIHPTSYLRESIHWKFGYPSEWYHQCQRPCTNTHGYATRAPLTVVSVKVSKHPARKLQITALQPGNPGG